MESLLSLSFDYLSSFDGGKIRKGLRQLEGLLAQICLSGSSTLSTPDRRRSVVSSPSKERAPKELSQLRDDPAFREFFKLQEGFEWNGIQLHSNSRHVAEMERLTPFTVAIRLISCLERLLGKGSSKSSARRLRQDVLKLTVYFLLDGQNDLLIVSTLDLLQGILLMHPPSRSLFAREIYMNVRLALSSLL